MNEFEKMSEREAHAQEIANSRVGCLGGSDAAMVLKVGRSGIEALSNTDLKRLRVMLGMEERVDFGGNAATKAGHDFEDYVAELVIHTHREYRMTGGNFRHFEIIAHADFYDENTRGVIECKNVQKLSSAAVLKRYYAQLQWYYLLGADVVHLLHGRGMEQPFEVESFNFVPKNAQTVAELSKGLLLIDDYCDKILLDRVVAQENTMSDTLADLVRKFADQKVFADEASKKLDEIRTEIFEYMQENELTTIKHAELGVVSFKKSSVTRKLDTDKVLQIYPELQNDPTLWKTSNVKASVSINLKKSK